MKYHVSGCSALVQTKSNGVCNGLFFFFVKDLLVRLVSVDLHTFGAEALTAIKLIEHQSTNSQVAEVRPQLVENVPPPVQGTSVTGKFLLIVSCM